MPDPDVAAELAAATAGPGSPSWPEMLNQLRVTTPPAERQELRRLADGMRKVLHGLVRTDAPIEVLTDAADQLEAIAELVGSQATEPIYEGFGEAANSGDPFAFFDHSPMLGHANPLAPPIELWVEGGVMRGRARFGAAYEGPPGCVHGGFVAAAFDEVLGSTQSLAGTPGMTGRLTVHYRHPTPLHTELQFEGELVDVDGRKITTVGRLYADKVLCAEAEGLFISIDFERFAELMERRRARRDGEAPSAS